MEDRVIKKDAKVVMVNRFGGTHTGYAVKDTKRSAKSILVRSEDGIVKVRVGMHNIMGWDDPGHGDNS